MNSWIIPCDRSCGSLVVIEHASLQVNGELYLLLYQWHSYPPNPWCSGGSVVDRYYCACFVPGSNHSNSSLKFFSGRYRKESPCGAGKLLLVRADNSEQEGSMVWLDIMFHDIQWYSLRRDLHHEMEKSTGKPLETDVQLTCHVFLSTYARISMKFCQERYSWQ